MLKLKVLSVLAGFAVFAPVAAVFLHQTALIVA